jgi:hypothetical protein
VAAGGGTLVAKVVKEVTVEDELFRMSFEGIELSGG